jgi:hypothetical protein
MRLPSATGSPSNPAPALRAFERVSSGSSRTLVDGVDDGTYRPSMSVDAARQLRHRWGRRARTLSATGFSRRRARCVLLPMSFCAKIEARCSLTSTPCLSHATCVRLIQPECAAGFTEAIARPCRYGCGVVCGWWQSGEFPRLWLPCCTARPYRARRDPDTGSSGNGTLKFRRESNETFRHSPARRRTLAPMQRPRRLLAHTVRSSARLLDTTARNPNGRHARSFAGPDDNSDSTRQ